VSRFPAVLRTRRGFLALQLFGLTVLVLALAWAVRDVWPEAGPRLADADPIQLAIGLAVLAAYYLLFIVGWMLILAAMGIRVPYIVALQAEMLSMLAKYVPGGVWTPAARIVAMRRFGITDTPVLLASILLEAGLSAVAGMLVFLASLPFVGVPVGAPLGPLVAFLVLVLVLLHPRVFRWLARKTLRRFGAEDFEPLAWRDSLAILCFYLLTWPVGGVALFFLMRAVGGDPDIAAIPFLGGAAAVGAIVAVLAVFAPSGLGVREGAMYGLILAVSSEGVALGATILNRFAITIVEALLLLIGTIAWRGRLWSREAREALAQSGR
jgi:glycosyltransferase 2 family protein